MEQYLNAMSGKNYANFKGPYDVNKNKLIDKD